MNIAYNASAGTGKTYQVTSLYERLALEPEGDPRDILLMTFTENAAAELRARVAARLLKARRVAEAADDFDGAERAIDAMKRLPSAPIGTIHSYCARLLREHALEAGLSPQFTVLAGDEREELLHRVSHEETLKRLESDPDFRAFCSGVQVLDPGGGFGASVAETVPTLISEAGSLGVTLENAEAMLPAPETRISKLDFERILQRIHELPKITPTVKAALDIIRSSLDETTDVQAAVARMEERGVKKFGRAAKAISDDFWALKEGVIAEKRYRERYPAAKAFARHVGRVAARFQQAKRALDAIDFDDQSRMATALLASGAAKPEFKHVIVDEVQDTSRAQCELIQSLWGPETRLVICGDKKQSIYSWRGADPRVMPDLQAAIRDRADGRVENLRASYRSKAPILDVVNALFSRVYDAADYTTDDQLEANPAFATADEKPCVEFLRFDGDEERSKQERGELEMEAVARRIQLLVNGSAEWRPNYRYDEGFAPTSERNAYRYSDILVLLGRTTRQSSLEAALRRAGVPYTLGGKGRGLFTRQETRDVSLFLNAITNPKDVYSLVGFLRSPWVGLSDETIATMALDEHGFSAARLADERFELIDRYRGQLGVKLASELTRDLIEETGFDAVLAGLPRGEQRLANLRKTLDWLRETERGARVTPAEVARILAERIANPPKVPEAAVLDPAQNAVTLMTVHGSKGLTKRVVMLPDISVADNADRGFARVYLDESGTPALGARLTAPDRSKAESPGFQQARQQASSVRRHEQKNLFYVAMTRARDLVITSATPGAKAAGWLEYLEPMLDAEIPTIPYSRLEAADSPAVAAARTTPSAAALLGVLAALPAPMAAPKPVRVPATRLAKEHDEQEPNTDPEQRGALSPDKAAALGSLAHAALEQLALNDWNGSAAEWLERSRGEFGASKQEAAKMEPRVTATAELMRELTADARATRPEFPFVLHQDDQLIDGSIDLLVERERGFAIYDYKFTESTDDVARNNYRGQMALYRAAAERAFPRATERETHLVVVSRAGPRLVSMDF